MLLIRQSEHIAQTNYGNNLSPQINDPFNVIFGMGQIRYRLHLDDLVNILNFDGIAFVTHRHLNVLLLLYGSHRLTSESVRF
ncbi:hypothetical protein D3C75_1286340 [compost metagenome]